MRIRQETSKAVALAALWTCAACSRGGDTSAAPPDDFAAGVPAGTGALVIPMAGTWEIRASVIMESNVPASLPPLAGTRVVLGTAAVEAIAGLGVSRANLENVLGFPLDLYVNQLDGRTVFYGAMFDRRAAGGTRELVALAGGTVNQDTLAVEQFASTLGPNDASEAYVRARYTLVRIAGALELAPDAPRAATGEGAPPPPTLLEVLQPLLGREAPPRAGGR